MLEDIGQGDTLQHPLLFNTLSVETYPECNNSYGQQSQFDIEDILTESVPNDYSQLHCENVPYYNPKNLNCLQNYEQDSMDFTVVPFINSEGNYRVNTCIDSDKQVLSESAPRCTLLYPHSQQMHHYMQQNDGEFIPYQLLDRKENNSYAEYDKRYVNHELATDGVSFKPQHIPSPYEYRPLSHPAHHIPTPVQNSSNCPYPFMYSDFNNLQHVTTRQSSIPEDVTSTVIQKRRPGRPRINSLPTDEELQILKKVKSRRLWEFIYEVLMNPLYNPRFLRWENQREGVSRFVQSEAVAQLWGGLRNNENMTYDKLSRAMRHYYKRGILERVEGRRLVYKFSRFAMDRVREKSYSVVCPGSVS